MARRKKPSCFFPPKKGHFVYIFCVSLCFSLALFGPPSFFTFSFFVSLVLFSFFLPSFLFLMSVSGSCFLFLILFAFCFKMLFFVLFLFCACFVLNHNIYICLLFCILFSCCCCFVFFLLLWYFVIFWFLELPIKKHPSKNWKFQKPEKMKNAEKKRTFWQEQLAQLCSQIVSFFFFVFL